MAATEVQVVKQLSSVDRSEWNALVEDGNPFVRHEFLAALESERCLGPQVGWLPNHFVARNSRGELVGAMPAYLKTNSFGEFVFDWAWASAYERAGFSYYPKLLNAAPFTPVTGPRLLVSPDADFNDVAGRLVEAAVVFSGEQDLSSFHCLFPREQDKAFVVQHGMLPRLNYQYHWRNRSYESFDHYLSYLRSRKRKNIRRERAQVRDAGITTRILHGDQLDPAQWGAVYGFYRTTFLRKGNYPALTPAFFSKLAHSMGRNLVVVLAEYEGRPIAAALNFRSDTHLYGRYWGCNEQFQHLHFEACFYRGIEYCIEHGLEVFEPGAQGEHKITRGFLPVATWSAHWISEPGFRAAIADFLAREEQALRDYRPTLDRLSPFRDNNA